MKGLKYHLTTNQRHVRNYVFNQAKKMVMKQTNGLYPAPLKIMEVCGCVWVWVWVWVWVDVGGCGCYLLVGRCGFHYIVLVGQDVVWCVGRRCLWKRER